MKKISLLGSTGSIGTQALDIIWHHQEQFSLVAMAVGKNITLAEQQIKRFSPKLVSVQTKEDRDTLLQNVPAGVKVVCGEEGLIEVAAYSEADIVINAVIGSVGLQPTIEAIKAGTPVAIANKETLVTAGHLITNLAKQHHVPLLPIDSEHSAIFQCLQGEKIEQVSRLILTASGGSFRDRTREELDSVTVNEALQHPNWSMGAKITVDSATMMNKGLEIIEAHWLFGIPYDNIDVVLHKESIIHSMVEFIDRGVVAQLGTPDMRVPIQYALSYPNRLEFERTERLNLWEVGALHFSKPDFERFRCLRYAYEAGKRGGTMPTVLNAANEVAVDLFLQGSIPFLKIETFIEEALARHEPIDWPTLEEILVVDRETREFVRSLNKQRWG